jgi:type II secretory pathway component GspD/PulD (secretin)
MMRTTITLAALLSLACASAATPQTTQPAEPAPSQQAPAAPRGSIDDSRLVISYFKPKNIRTSQAGELANLLFGESIFVSSEAMPPREMAHFMTVKDTLVVRDTPEQAKRILAALQELDQKAAPDQGASPAQVKTTIYTPRHVTANDLVRAVHPFMRGNELSQLAQEQRILLSGSAERIHELNALLASLDLPRPQVVITAYLVRGSSADQATSSAALPKELVENLRKLLPMQAFELVATSVVRASVAGDAIGVNAAPSPSISYTMSMLPAAYDPQSGQLTLSKLSFQVVEGQNVPGTPQPARQSFETSLSVRAGEYAVLGAVGGDPIFLVLRVQPVG